MKSMLPVAVKESLEELREGVSSLMDRWFPHVAKPASIEEGGWPTALWASGGPVVDVAETEKDVVVKAELPGLDERDFHVEFQGDRLILRGEKKATRERKEDTYYFSECSYGSFYRALPMPCEVDSDKAEAAYKNGILTVTLPKTQEAMKRRIRVSVE